MSTSVGTAVPGNVNLSKQKPYAVSAYSRRVKSLANNAQAFGPDSYVNITLDTSTPGSFLDPLQSYLKWDLTILNSNPFCDFVSFGQAGSAALIEEFRIYVQGTPIEEILQYNVFYELAMNQNGQCQQPYELFTSNKNVQPVTQIFHQNAIKPPMVDRLGKPMYGVTKKVNGSSRACSYITPTNSTSFLTSKMVASQSMLSTKVCFSGCRPYFTTAIGAETPNLLADAQSLLFGLGAAKTGELADAVIELPAGTTLFNETFPSYFRSSTNAIVNPLAPSAMLKGSMAGMTSVGSGLELSNSVVAVEGGAVESNFANYLVAQDGGILPYAGTTVEVPSCIGGSVSSIDPDLDPTNPLNWSTLLPESAIRVDLKTLGPQNLQDYFMFLSNCKYIPVGMPGIDKNNAATWDNVYAPPQGYISSNNFRNLQQYDAANDTRGFTYTCCIPLISGVLGSFADKCWPTMLVAPGSMYIQIRTASPQKAFQLSMDPCRRVLGTIRDYLPFGGTIGGLFGQVGKSNVTNGINTNTVPPAGNLTLASNFYNNAPSAGGSVSQVGSFPQNMNGCLPLNTFSDYLGVKSFAVDANANIIPTVDSRSVHSKINGYCCLGSSLVSASVRLNQQVFDNNQTRGFGLLFKPYSVAAMEGKWTIGRAYVSQMQTAAFSSGLNTFIKSRQISEEGHNIIPTNSGYGTNLLPNASQFNNNASLLGTSYPNTANDGDAINAGTKIPSVAARQSLAAFVSASGAAFTASGQDSLFAAAAGYSPDADVTVDFSPAGIPLPQYFLHATPWLAKTFAYKIGLDGANVVNYQMVGMQQSNVASEATACYGTYLTASVPQCRRVLTHLSSGSNGGITYSLSNIEFVSQQIILPDSVSASILEDAAQGDISINANSLHNYQTPIAQSDSQNLIIPAKIASANTMYCLFQPQTFVSGTEAFCYNSLRGICPFGSVAVPTGSGIVQNGLTSTYSATGSLGYDDGEIVIRNIPCSSGQLQVQLKIGNELVPQQPLTTMNEIMTENVKAQHKLFDSLSNVNSTFALTNKRTITLGVDDYSSALCYDVVAPETFCTTFVSAELTDDQTAIDNPCMAWVYACEANFLGTGNQKTKSSYVINRKPNQMEMFQPPASTFAIAFDLDTWSRYSDVTRSGKFLGNNTITLTMQNAVALGYAPNQVRSGGFVLQTFIVHDIRFSFQAGGSVVSYY